MAIYKEELYDVCKDGRIWSNKHKKFLKPFKNSVGYLQVFLTCKDGKKRWFRIHRLVAEKFIPNPNNLPEVNHKNEDKTLNSVENLEWCDRKYNINYGLRNKKLKANAKPKIRFKEKKEVYLFDIDCNLIGIYNSIKEASEKTGLSYTSIWKSVTNKLKTYKNCVWRYV